MTSVMKDGLENVRESDMKSMRTAAHAASRAAVVRRGPPTIATWSSPRTVRSRSAPDARRADGHRDHRSRGARRTCEAPTAS